MGSDGFRWVLMGSDGFRWVRFRWFLMGSDGFRWVKMGSDGFWWVPCVLVLQVVYHERHIQRFWERHRSLFPDAVLVGPEENLQEDKARTMAV